MVYAPTINDEGGQARLRMHRLADERVSLFVYSALDRLEAQYGEGSPWVLMSPGHLEDAHQESPFDLLLLDRELYPQGAGDE